MNHRHFPLGGDPLAVNKKNAEELYEQKRF
jgi:hypothetical protein